MDSQGGGNACFCPVRKSTEPSKLQVHKPQESKASPGLLLMKYQDIEFESQLGKNWGAWCFCPKPYMNQKISVLGECTDN